MRSQRTPSAAWTPTAASTNAPPINVASRGISSAQAQTQSGDKIASSNNSRATSAAGRPRLPTAMSEKPSDGPSVRLIDSSNSPVR